MHLDIQDSTGAVTLDPWNLLKPRAGYTHREATADEVTLINTKQPGRLTAVNGALTRIAPPDPVPPTITQVQLRLWLVKHNIPVASVDAAIAAIPEAAAKAEAQVRWEYSTEVQRANPLVAALGAALSLTSAQVDDAFREASKL